MTDKLKSLRDKIDALDARLVKLLSARARLAQHVGQVKQGAAVYRPSAKRRSCAASRELNAGPLPDRALQRVYTEIMSACRALEDQHDASRSSGPKAPSARRPRSSISAASCRSRRALRIDEVFRQVETGAVGYAVVPVENSTEGAVGRTLDLLLATDAARLRRSHAARYTSA